MEAYKIVPPTHLLNSLIVLSVMSGGSSEGKCSMPTEY